MARILIVDDEKKMRHLLSMMVESRGHHAEQAGDGRDALEQLTESAFDMVITDIKMPKMDGIALLNEINTRKIHVPVVFITAFATVDSAVEAMRQGAVDYITKPFEEERILLTVERTLKLSRIMAENRELKQALTASTEADIIYASAAMASVMQLAQKVARADAAVMISGESGTGKEVLARFIHQASPRKENRFVPVNCAAISPNLVESELFGHERGAFTGADRRALGKFEFAAGGTLFLDEIGDLPLEAQGKLLRALQEKRIQRVGGNDEIPVDVRFVCATNRDLAQLVAEKDFRQDLFFRINVFPIHIPPLRERMDDIEPLAKYFLGRLGPVEEIRISSAALKRLKSYHWPGNVRELANAIERAMILERESGEISENTFCFIASPPEKMEEDASKYRLPAQGISLEALENDLAKQALAAADGNQTAAARLLGLSRAKFRVLMKQALSTLSKG